MTLHETGGSGVSATAMDDVDLLRGGGGVDLHGEPVSPPPSSPPTHPLSDLLLKIAQRREEAVKAEFPNAEDATAGNSSVRFPNALFRPISM